MSVTSATNAAANSSETLNRSGDTRSPRFVTLDAMRTVAAIGVVIIHGTEAPATEPLSRAARFAVPFFFAVGGYFAARSERAGRPWSMYAARRVRRLYIPFLAWATIYYLVRLAASLALPGRSPPYHDINLLMDSPAQHLWFLPGLLLTTVGVFSLTRLLRGASIPAVVVALVFLMLAVGASLYRLPTPPVFPYTAAMTWGHLPAPLAGAAVALVTLNRPFLPRPVNAASAVAFLGCIVWLVCVGRATLVENFAGLCLMLASLTASARSPMIRLARWSTLAFGVYVVHVLFVESAQDAMNFVKAKPSLVRDLSIILFALIASIIVVRVMMRWRWTRWMVAAD